MKILLIDKNLVDPINHEKWRILSRKPSIHLTAICPDRWEENSRMLRLSPEHITGFPIFPLHVIWPRYYNRAMYTPLGKLIRLLRRTRPEIVICFEEPFSGFALQWLVLHSLFCRNAKLVFYTWDNLSEGLHYPGRWPYPYLYRAIAAWSARRAALILTATQEGADFLGRRTLARVKKLYFGVTFESPRQEETAPTRRLWPGKFVVGYFGRLLEMKGLKTILEALAILPEQFVAIFVGSGPEKDSLLSSARTLGISDRVRFVPSVTSLEARTLMAQVDVLVLPSRTTTTWKEQFGRVLVEAMYLGVPVIGSCSGAIPDVMGEAGFVFPEGNATVLASRILTLEQQPEVKAEMVSLGRKRARVFSADRFAEDIYGMLMDLVRQ